MRNLLALGIRVFSTSTSRYDAIHTLRNSKYIALVHKETKHPLWRLLDALRQPKHLLTLSDALHGNGISTAEFDRWKSLLHEPSIETVSQETLHSAPSWMLLYLISNKVRSSHHAHGPMLDLVYSHLDTAPNEFHGPLILLAAVQLARFDLVVPLRHLAQTFLSIWIEDPLAYFNLMLQVISCIPNRTVESANIAVLLLRAMESRQLMLSSDTYEALLNDRFVTLQLTKYLQARMVQEGFVPQTSHLEAYLRFFAKDGAIHDAKKYYDAIHAQSAQVDETISLLDPSSIPKTRANTLMLGTYTSAPPAFGFLRQLASTSQPAVTIPSTKRDTRTLARLLRTKFHSVYDLTSALSVLTRDSRCTPSHLLKLFHRAPGGRPTVVTYTILIRGLLQRGDTVNAVSYWKRLLKSGVAIDPEALATGVVALTRAGRPHDALMLLEQFGSRLDDTSAEMDAGLKRVMLRKPVKVTQKTINDFMVALNRIQRPDVVFRIWDHMEQLYGIQPNALSLSILLQSARLAHKLDDTLSGALAHLSLKNPFRRSSSLPRPLTRESAFASIMSLLQDPIKGKPARYTSGIWHDCDPTTAVRKVFLQTLFGMAIEQERGDECVREMLKLESPASAVRTSVDDDPAAGLGFGLRKLRGMKYSFEAFEDLFSTPSSNTSTTSVTPTQPKPRSHYPSIFPTNSTCLQYILLLALSSRSNEIPLLLSWMKYLRIQPSSSTLALSLAAWSEVSIQAPLVERIQSGGGGVEVEGMIGREYVKLVRWIRDWVGEKRMPGAREIGKWEKVVRKVREVKR